MTTPSARQTTARISTDTRELANTLAIELSPGAKRRLTQSEVIDAAVELASENRDALIAKLTDPQIGGN